MTAPTPTPGKSKEPLTALVAGVEQMLSELTDEQFAALVARVRPPADTDAPATATKADQTDYPESWGYGNKKGAK